MSAPEPLTLTLEEAAQLLGEQGLVLILDGASGAASRWSVRPWSAPRDWMKEELGATWPEVVGAARGRPVVARDEAAELRAALREWREAGRAEAAAHKAWNNAIAAQPPLTKYIDDWQAAKDRLDDAMAALRRLAATEGRGE